VLTLYKGGAVKQLEKMLQDYKEDITALHKIQRRGKALCITAAKK
jgi:hypothetical protein